MGWIDSLGGLPETVATLVVFAFCVVWIIKSILKRVVDPLAKSHEASAETLRRAIDTNSDAVKKSVDHNETIIKNHLSREQEMHSLLVGEMKAVSTALLDANSRRRSGD